jgi:hypothetical protein
MVRTFSAVEANEYCQIGCQKCKVVTLREIYCWCAESCYFATLYGCIQKILVADFHSDNYFIIALFD